MPEGIHVIQKEGSRASQYTGPSGPWSVTLAHRVTDLLANLKAQVCHLLLVKVERAGLR
jgi:hypothetical protein